MQSIQNIWLAVIPSGSCLSHSLHKVSLSTQNHAGSRLVCLVLRLVSGCELSTTASSIVIILDVYSFCPESPCSSASLACTSFSPVCFVPSFPGFLLFLFCLLFSAPSLGFLPFFFYLLQFSCFFFFAILYFHHLVILI